MAVIRPQWRTAANVHALSTTRLAGDMAASCAMPPGVPARPRWLRQVHGVAIADLDALPEEGPLPVADAAFTTRPGVVCVVRTADCLPVLLAARDGSVVAAAHAGWRGLAAGVIEATVAAMRARAGRDVLLQAWLGPAIGPGHFEVGEEVRAAFLAADSGAHAAFVPAEEGRWMCDLAALARRRLAALGIGEVSACGHCTYAEEQRFFSHRRDVQHRGLDATGRMASCIWRT
ncbi:MAG: peptidoglycan editing factor PgeF [Pseudomonadota bacterium]|jgi:YfiH family protein|nr:MAG: peptidoglycan editing factor PgeF [Pseudomonadota bacterium]